MSPEREKEIAAAIDLLEYHGREALAEAIKDLRAENAELAEQLCVSRQSEKEVWRYKTELEAARDAFAKAATEAQAERDAAREERDALLKDAARYRWLRVQPNDTSAPRIDVVHWVAADESCNDGTGLRLEELDAAIDKAMSSSSKEGK